MSKVILRAAACAALLSAGAVWAKPTAQQNCDKARVAAWVKYVSCVDGIVEKQYVGTSPDLFTTFAKCRHTYFKNWAAFQTRASLATSTCALGLSNRYTDNGDQTVTDNLTGLVWEKKSIDIGVHNHMNTYTWGAGSPPYYGAGTAFATFLTDAATGLNVTAFAGAQDWRLPTLTELQTILKDFPCTAGAGKCLCGSFPCIEGTFGLTPIANYWSATSYVPSPGFAWYVDFGGGGFGNGNEASSYSARAVRGGL